jgi:outer membrane protein assembly factor BamA
MTRALFVLLFCATTAAAQTGPGVVGEVRVHGNHTTPDDKVMSIIGDVVGQPATDALVNGIAGRLEQSGRFESVEVRKRFRSIADPDDILIMVVVDEFPGVDPLDDYLPPSPVKRFWASGMFLPILHFDDGYGFTYGLRTTFVDRLGPRSRISVPLSWGGERQARLQLERTFKDGPVDRVAGEFGIGRKENPHYEIGDTRTSFSARVEGAPLRWLRYGVGGGIDDVGFGDADDRLETFGADATIDTRVDPAFPRNAIHARVGWERLRFDAGRANRRTLDARGYLGLFGGSVLALRGLSITSDAPLPVYEQNLLGGPSSLRGFDTGYLANDNLAGASAEIRIPLTSPLSVGRFGVKVFADYGTAYPHGQKLGDQTFDLGMGGGAYMHLTLISLGLDVAKGRNADWRFHFGMGVTFK